MFSGVPEGIRQPRITKRAAPHKVLLLVRPGGFEPLAFRVGAERSIQLSYDRLCMKNALQRISIL